jgi:hypothetical protein
MQDYVLRGVPDCLRRDAWWLPERKNASREGREGAEGGSAQEESGLSSGPKLPEPAK